MGDTLNLEIKTIKFHIDQIDEELEYHSDSYSKEFIGYLLHQSQEFKNKLHELEEQLCKDNR